MGEKEQAGIRKSSGSRDSDFASLQNCTRVGYIEDHRWSKQGVVQYNSNVRHRSTSQQRFTRTDKITNCKTMTQAHILKVEMIYLDACGDHELQDSGHRHTS